MSEGPPPSGDTERIEEGRAEESSIAVTGRDLRHIVSLGERRFDAEQLPADMRRVYGHLKEQSGEEYALAFVFTMRTAVELHRAWHVTLLTSKILQQIKERFGVRMTWDLGVFVVKFRVEDGGYELHRTVPYDYDSEFQDMYMRIAVALIEGQIDVHEALIFQNETEEGRHTARSGLFLRGFPGRLVLYPIEAATCSVIFFYGDWEDAGVAAVCGLAAGLIDCALDAVGGEAKVLVDVLVGVSTGAIGTLFYRFVGGTGGQCLSAIFLGTLYWFFYGTAFVIGLLEIIAGQLETGVTRFIAVTVKTFVLCLGAGLGMMLSSDSPRELWIAQDQYCRKTNLGEKWWRIPLYLLCSASALGQYRFPIVHYPRGLAVQLAAYEVQYQALELYARGHQLDNLDTASANVLGAMAAVVSAYALSYVVGQFQNRYYARLLQRDHGKTSKFDEFIYNWMASNVRISNRLGIGRQSDSTKLEMEKKLRRQAEELRSPHHPRTEIVLEPEEETALLETIVDAQIDNIWATLMPALYQLVPGAMIARLWFNSIYPPSPDGDNYEIESNVFSNLMVISTSLALGLILGFALVKVSEWIFSRAFPCLTLDKERMKRARDRLAGMYTVRNDDLALECEKYRLTGGDVEQSTLDYHENG